MYSESSRPHTPESYPPEWYPVAAPPFQVVSETSSSPYYTAFSGSANLPLHTPSSGPSHLHFHRSSHQWSTGLCHCFDDPGNCFITFVCPCITFGHIAAIANKSPTCVTSGTVYALLMGLTGFPCLCSCYYRLKLRKQFDLEEAPCQDCLVHCCCEHRALCQEYRELHNRGFDMGIGWSQYGKANPWHYNTSTHSRRHDEINNETVHFHFIKDYTHQFVFSSDSQLGDCTGSSLIILENKEN